MGLLDRTRTDSIQGQRSETSEGFSLNPFTADKPLRQSMAVRSGCSPQALATEHRVLNAALGTTTAPLQSMRWMCLAYRFLVMTSWKPVAVLQRKCPCKHHPVVKVPIQCLHLRGSYWSPQQCLDLTWERLHGKDCMAKTA